MHSAPRFRLALVIDRLAVDFCVRSPTQAWRIRSRLGSSATYVQGLDQNGIAFGPTKANTPTTWFRATFQDPQRKSDVLGALQTCGSVTSPKLVMLEAALDVYIKGADKEALSYVVANLYRFLEAQPTKYWHIYRNRGESARLVESDPELSFRSLAQHLAAGCQLADTPDKRVHRRFHGYVKSYDFDAESGTVSNLPNSQWRARLEVTLQDTALPTDNNGAFESLNLAKLSDQFRFRKFADDLHPAARHALERVSVRQHGREGKYPRMHQIKVGVSSGPRTKFRTSTQADVTMNESVRMAIRKLIRGWSSTRPTTSRARPNKDFRALAPSFDAIKALSPTPTAPIERVQ